MSEYVIKNCPACRQYNVFGVDDKPCCYSDMKYCQDITDCLLKKIVEKCKNVECNCIVDKNKCGAMDNMPECCDLWKSKDILSLLDIEECE